MERKRNPLALLALFAGGIVVGEISGVITAFSLPESWAKLAGLVSNLVRPLADDRVDDVGFSLLVAGVALFALGLILAYRRLRGRTILPGELRDLMPEMSGDQETLLTLMLQHGVTLRVPSDRPPRRSLLAVAVPIIAVGTAMILSNPPPDRGRHFPPVALGPATALTEPGGKTAPPSSSPVANGGADAEAAQEAGASASGSTLPLKGEGSSCTCPPVIPAEGSTGGESEHEFEESEPEEEPVFEAEETEFEAEEAEFEAEADEAGFEF